MLSVFVSACEISIMLPASYGLPAPVPGLVETIVVATAGAAQTQTAALIMPTYTPTWTPLPTHTPSLTPSPTRTFIFKIGPAKTAVRSPTRVSGATDTPSAANRLDGCALLSQTPSDGSHFAAKESFKVAWKVKNTGSAAWDADAVDFAYVSGTKMHKKQLYDLPANIPVGESVTLTVSMIAPSSDGVYSTVWSLRRGQKNFCHVDLTIRVP